MSAVNWAAIDWVALVASCLLTMSANAYLSAAARWAQFSRRCFSPSGSPSGPTGLTQPSTMPWPW